MLPATLTDELQKLNDLRQSKAISQVDYDRHRQDLYRNYGLSSPGQEPLRHGVAYLLMLVAGLSVIAGAIFGDIIREFGGHGTVTLLMMVVLSLYLVPAFIAYGRNHRQRHAILILNILFGWSFAGWIIALIWSVLAGQADD